jgi:nucleolar protein 12
MASGQVDAARGSAHAYVVFKEAAAAEAALAHNMREWEGNHLRVDRAGVNGLKARGVKKGGGAAAARRLAAAAPAVQYDPERSVFVGNLHIEAEVSQGP